MSNYGKCKSCGKRVQWIRMRSGRLMPVDDLFVNYRIDPRGKDKIVTPDGEVVTGIAGVRPDEANGFGYISHFATCPNARNHRRK